MVEPGDCWKDRDIPTPPAAEERRTRVTFFGITTSIDGSTARVALIGEIDLAAVPAIQDCARTLLTDDLIRDVEVDLSAATFIDSSGVGALIGGRKLAARQGKTCTLTGIHGRVAHVLDTMA